jgi:HAD superfamily hydrolase (TIGR01509 family)
MREYDRISMSVVAAVVFDFDGVILDSESAEFESHRRIFDRHGLPLTPEEWCDQIGVWVEEHERRWCARLNERCGASMAYEDFKAEQHRIFHEILAREPMRGIRELLDALADAGVPTAVASTSSSRWVVPAVERLGLTDRFRTIVTANDVERRKPAPDVYIEAVRRLGADPRRSVAIEDSGPGIASASAAGLKTVAIPHWLTRTHDLAPAALRVEHAGELTLERLERLVNGSR